MKRFSPVTVFVFLAILFVVVAAVEISVGPMWLPLSRIIPDTRAYFLGSHSADAVVMGAIRLPRVVVALFVGAGLASTGAVLQAVFRNPMADPGVIGVSSGAALGAVFSMQLGAAAIGIWAVPMFAFVAGLITVFVIYALATVKGFTSIYALLLAGVAISALSGAGVDLLLALSPLQSLQQALFWLMGGLDGSTWTNAFIVGLFFVFGFLIYYIEAPTLDVLSLGDEQAHGVGVHVERKKRLLLTICAFVVGSCISVSGAIGFVGLIIPHSMRLILGPSHRMLLPASAIGGAILLIASDIVARTVMMPVEINIGIVTSALGVPFFLFLLRKQQRLSRHG